MDRRSWLRSAAWWASGLAARRALPSTLEPREPAQRIDRVLLITKCHLDVGFTMTQERVIRRYFEVYFPAAMQISTALREAGPDRYIWTTGSWLLYEYLEQASSADRRKIEASAAAGDLAWHALPFSWQTEMLDRSMIEGGLGFSAALDARFGRRTIAAKMTDVPGHTRGIIAPLQAAGVKLLDIGVNPASTPPEVPDLFLWKDSAGHTLPVLYHRHDYGSVVPIPGTSLAVAVEVRGDNSGPHTLAEIAAIYARLRASFPNANVVASNLNEAAAAVEGVRERLPIVTSEIGDTWIYGVSSDPAKISRFRAVTRLRQGWIAQRRFAVGDTTDLRLLRRLLLSVEHTWGTDTKSYLDDQHYRPGDLQAVLSEPGYRTMETSWQEKRDDLDQAVDLLPPTLAQEARLHLQASPAVRPSHTGLHPHPPAQAITNGRFTVALDPRTGAIIRLEDHASGRDWASPDHPLALFTYQTLSAQQYADFLDRYIKIKADWAPRDFGKPGIERFGAVAREWHPQLVECWSAQTDSGARLLLELRIEDHEALAQGSVAWPREILLDLRLPSSGNRVDLTLTVLDKPPNRMPEAMWLTFNPRTSPTGAWTLDKSGEQVGVSDVVRGGGRAMHGLTGDLLYRDRRSSLALTAIDTAMLAIGDRSPLNFSLRQPTLSDGFHVGLFNNAWGTNYLQWCGGSWSFRFSLVAT